jgi:hypothetical protein
MIRFSLHTVVSLILAVNYFAFQVEVFESEYEANHVRGDGSSALSSPTLTWETFDKENAAKAFVVDAGMRVEFLFLLSQSATKPRLVPSQFQPVRDKSPPIG